MPKPPKSEKKFEEKVLLTISESTSERGGGTTLRVMCWVVDGKEMKPCIDKREWWMTEDDERRIGKAKGLSKFDLLEILRNIDKIARLMEIPASDIEACLTLERAAAPDLVSAAPADARGEDII